MASNTEHPANVKSSKDLSTSGPILPLKQPSPQSSSHGTSPSLTNEIQSAASTPKTTPESIASEKTEKWFRSLSRVDQLEFFVKIKIETFRKHMRVHNPQCDRQWYIDEEEDERRRKFFEKKGEEAYWARYIDSDYTGRVEFLYVDPKEIITGREYPWFLDTLLPKSSVISVNPNSSRGSGTFGMLLCTPKDKAIQSIRLATSSLFQANKGLLAQRLINELERSICDISARRFYPSWYNHLDPDQVMNWETSGKDALRTAVRHLWDACLDFEAAGIRGAAYVCLEFCTQIVIDELLTASGTVESP